MSIQIRPLTYDDLLRTPDDRSRYEIIDGALIVTPAPVPLHQKLSGRLFSWLYGHVTRNGLGEEVYAAPIDVKLSEHDVVEPDLIFISQARRHLIGDRCIEGAPDLVVEILSPSTRRRDLEDKLRLYARAGVREYWLADMEARGFRILTLVDGAYVEVPPEGNIVRSVVLPGLAVDVVALFAGL